MSEAKEEVEKARLALTEERSRIAQVLESQV